VLGFDRCLSGRSGGIKLNVKPITVVSVSRRRETVCAGYVMPDAMNVFKVVRFCGQALDISIAPSQAGFITSNHHPLFCCLSKIKIRSILLQPARYKSHHLPVSQAYFGFGHAFAGIEVCQPQTFILHRCWVMEFHNIAWFIYRKPLF
jgi:hypothetical protein